MVMILTSIPHNNLLGQPGSLDLQVDLEVKYKSNHDSHEKHGSIEQSIRVLLRIKRTELEHATVPNPTPTKMIWDVDHETQQPNWRHVGQNTRYREVFDVQVVFCDVEVPKH